jgi:hypothetical protein
MLNDKIKNIYIKKDKKKRSKSTKVNFETCNPNHKIGSNLIKDKP